MTEPKGYTCRKCGSKVEVNSKNKSNPICCDEPMENLEDLESCRASSTAEHSRFKSDDEPCDDGRSGKI